MTQTDYQIEKEIYKTIEECIKARLRNLAFNYCEEGAVAKVNSDGTYNVRINNDIYENIKTINTNVYKVNDVVWIEKINGDSKYKYIKCKV